MNAFAPIDIGAPTRIAEAMDAEGVRLIERLKVGFRVVLIDGRTGKGFSIREAIASAMRAAA